MSKFKVGDIVVDKGFPNTKLRIIQDDSRFNPNSHTYAVKPLRGGAVTSSNEDDLRLANSARSANPVVANALAASGGVARNADGDKFFDDGRKALKDAGFHLAAALAAYRKSDRPEAKAIVAEMERIGQKFKDWLWM